MFLFFLILFQYLQDKNGFTALTLAADNGHSDVVRLLCENGAYLDTKTKDGKTALDTAKAKKRNSVIDVLHVAQLTTAAKSSGHGMQEILWQTFYLLYII